MSSRSKKSEKTRRRPGSYAQVGDVPAEQPGRRRPKRRGGAAKLGPLGLHDARTGEPGAGQGPQVPKIDVRGLDALDRPGPATQGAPQGAGAHPGDGRGQASERAPSKGRPAQKKGRRTKARLSKGRTTRARTQRRPDKPADASQQTVSLAPPGLPRGPTPGRPRGQGASVGALDIPDADLPALAQVPEGTLISRQYTVLEKLGEGGMGVVLRCRDGHLQRDVALKMIRPALMVRDDMRERFLVEAQAMARVGHPNVVKIFAFGEHQGAPYFVMELVQGITVEAWFWDTRVQRGTLPTVDEILGVFEQCCRGVTAIHASGTLHGDLKPSNVLLGDTFRVAITDLGLACMMDRGEYEAIAGTPAYMAPEGLDPVQEPALAPRRDVYSLGVIAYELFTGQLPHEVATLQDFLDLTKAPPPRPPSELRADLPSAFDEPLLRALRADARERTESAEALRAELMAARRSVSRRRADACIVVADDDPDFLVMADRTLTARFPEAEIILVPDGEQAIAACAARDDVDLAIVDLNMPGANGVEVTTALRGLPGARRCRILVVTAFGGGRDWSLLSGLGADAFLVKPFDLEAFTATVAKLLAADAGVAAG